MKSRHQESSRRHEIGDRPVKLYHASPVVGIDVLEPGNKTIRDPNEGPVVFATPDKVSAMGHLFESDDRWTQMGRINGVHFILIAAERDAFIKQDKGGTLYELPNAGFECDETMESNEWTCKTSVSPTAKENFPSALDAMLENGFQVYFVDTSTLKRFQAAQDTDDRIKILTGITSENQSRQLNVKSFGPTLG